MVTAAVREGGRETSKNIAREESVPEWPYRHGKKTSPRLQNLPAFCSGMRPKCSAVNAERVVETLLSHLVFFFLHSDFGRQM